MSQIIHWNKKNEIVKFYRYFKKRVQFEVKIIIQCILVYKIEQNIITG